MIRNSPSRQPDNGRPPALGLPPPLTSHNDAIRIVCAALGLACVMLALRIASIW